MRRVLQFGNTALHLAAVRGHRDVVRASVAAAAAPLSLEAMMRGVSVLLLL
jgi:ankyrin repeat protein